MSASTFKIFKQCQHCGNMFEAQKVSTACCSHKCSSARYKLKKRLEIKGEIEATQNETKSIRPKATAVNKALLKDKEFLTAKELSTLFGCNVKTVYAMIQKGTIKASALSPRKTLIKRTDIDKIFE